MQKRIAADGSTVAWLLLVVAASAFAADANSSNSAVGNWILNPTKSHFENMPAPKLERLRILKDDPKALSWTMSGFDVDGKAFHEFYDGPTDGAYHPIVGSSNASECGLHQKQFCDQLGHQGQGWSDCGNWIRKRIARRSTL